MAQDNESGEKTEEATPRRREEAREKGQVALSTEFVAAISLFAALGLYLTVSASVCENLGSGVRAAFLQLSSLGAAEIDVPTATSILRSAGEDCLGAILLVGLPLLGMTLLLGYGQVGLHLSPKALEWDLSKLNPVKGLGRLFSMRTVVRTGLSTLKLASVGAAIFITTYTQLGKIAGIDGVDVGPALLTANDVVVRAAIAALIAILAIGLIDLLFQRWQHGKDLRMTKQEVREEHKSLEGDPHIKARVRQVQRDLATRRMMHDVPNATVVVTNPTHYAVALKYDREGADGGAPRVVAKGADFVAQRIKEVARESGVLCFENVPLARALHARCEIGDVIPEELFEAVASVLAYVYRVQGERVSTGVSA
jgi:flagellar biosynthetic protein FlhB